MRTRLCLRRLLRLTLTQHPRPMPTSNTVLLCLLASLALGAVIRALKSDTAASLGASLPPRLRAPLALLLGQVMGVVEAVALGTPWRDAAVHGLVAGLGAIGGHEVVVEAVMGGREIGAGEPPAE